MNNLFKVDKLNEISEKHFKMACVTAMSEKETLKGSIAVPCSNEYVLYSKEKASVIIKNWSNLLTLSITSINGTTLLLDHINGMGVREVLEEAYRRFLVVKPYINQKTDNTFKEVSFCKDANFKWLVNCESIMSDISNYLQTKVI